MGHKVILTPVAIEDLRKIVEFIAKDNAVRARAFGDLLLDRALAVGEFPQSGRVVPEIGDAAVRESIHQAFRIIYEIRSDPGVVYILRFWHAARGDPIIVLPQR